MRTIVTAANEQKTEEIRNTSPMYQGVVAKALEKRASPRQAIKARCLQCTNFQRLEISACQVARCALWEYRPYQDTIAGDEDENPAEASAETTQEGIQEPEGT